jgi:hypothetical protein
MKHVIRVAALLVLLLGAQQSLFAQACAKQSALSQDWENNSFGSWSQSVINCNSQTYSNSCDFTWGGLWQGYGWGACRWCILPPGYNSSYSAVLDLACTGGATGHVEGVLTSPSINFAAICDPTLPPPALNFAYAYRPAGTQDQFGIVQMSIEATPDVSSPSPSWFIVSQFTDMGSMATGPAIGDLGSGFYYEYGFGNCSQIMATYAGARPTSAQWKLVSVNLPKAVASGSNAAVRFRVYVDGGSLGSAAAPIWIDQITVDGAFNKDLAVSKLNTFNDSIVVAPTSTFTPTARVRQVGSLSPASANLTYQIYPLNTPGQLLYSQVKTLGPGQLPSVQCTETGDIAFNATSPTTTQVPGEYTLRSFVTAASAWDCNPANDTTFANLVVGYDYDVKPLFVSLPTQLRQEDIVSLPQNPTAMIRNIGLNDVLGFRVQCDIYDPTNSLVYTNQQVITSTLASGLKMSVAFAQFTPTVNGIFKFRVITQLGSDMNRRNDTLIETRTFYWKYDVRADSVVVGLNALSFLPEVPQGGAYRPVGRFDNAGASFVADIPITFQAWPVPLGIAGSGNARYYPPYVPGDTAEFTSKDTMPEVNIQDGMRKIAFNSNPLLAKIWTPQQSGPYLLLMWSDLPNDGDRTNDTVKLMVSSIPRLLGTYQVGFGQLIPSIDAALDSLNYRGVRGNVTFQLMDNNYNYATDLSFKKVRFAGPGSAVTFTPAPGVSSNINLSNNGRLVWDLGASYIGFDGSNSTTGTPNRALTVTQGTNGTTAFFLTRGASNNVIKNCNIRTSSVSGQTVTKQLQGSIGIWEHNFYPSYPNDTMSCSYNLVENNDIQGFRTAIWMEGLAPAFIAGSGRYAYRWDTLNTVRNNVITNCARAGILMTNQYAPRVSGNEVYGLTNIATTTCGTTTNEDANVVGIGLGGVRTRCDQPFDNNGISPTFLDSAKGYAVEAQVFNNKVHDLLAANGKRVVGIEIIQDTVWGNIKGAPSTLSTPGLWPTVTHNVLWNNMIWGLSDTTGEATGILLDARGLPNFFTSKDSVMNNTVWLAGSQMNRAYLLDFSRSNNVMVWNNILVNSSTAPTRGIARFVGQKPAQFLNCNRNLLYFGSAGTLNNITATIQILDADGYYRDQKTYPTLESWQAGTLNDKQSLYGDPKFKSTAAPIDLHIMSFADGVWSPAYQQGGYLPNSVNRYDFDGEQRGIGGTNYDIGADEFFGKSYANDIFAMRIDAPTSSGGTRMVENPVNVQATLQNVGTSTQLKKRVFLTVTQVGGGVVFRDSSVVDFKVNETKQLTFKPFSVTNAQRYVIAVAADVDNNSVNDTVSTTQTFYAKQNEILLSYRGDTPNARADRDSVIKSLRRWGFRYDVLDRSTIARPEDISYAPWHTVIYCAENGTAARPTGGNFTYALSYDERQQLMAFLDLGVAGPAGRRSLVIAGMDIANFHDQLASDVSVRDTLLTRQYLHLRYTGTPSVAAFAGTLTGVRISPAVREQLTSTGTDHVDALAPIRVAKGTTEYAYYYNGTVRGVSTVPVGSDTAAGVTFAGQQDVVNMNTVVYGFDWRHLTRLTSDSTSGIGRVMLNTLDFIQKNNGCIVPCAAPVELAAFDAKLVRRDVLVSWETASETNVSQFNVERKSSNGGWNLVDRGTVASRGSVSMGARYQIADMSVPAGVYDYRLAYIHTDGHVEYSNTRQVVVPGAYALYQNYPNPFNPTTNIDYVLMDGGSARLTLYDVMGNAVKTLVNEYQDAGAHSFTLDASDLSSGVYYYRLEVNGFVASRRMMLMK